MNKQRVHVRHAADVRADILADMKTHGLLERFRAVLEEAGAREAEMLSGTQSKSCIAARKQWWGELSEAGWTDLEIGELHRTDPRSVQTAVLRRLRA